MDLKTESLIERLVEIRREMLELEEEAGERLRLLPRSWQKSARNLIHYIALRRHDLREIQEDLVPRGLSSLGRCEGFVMANVEAVLKILRSGSPTSHPPLASSRVAIHYAEAKELLRRRAEGLFGVPTDQPAIMVTMPSEASADAALVHNLVRSGMAVMRINCAHDDPATWKGMIDNLRRAEQELGRGCRVAMDLAGPKIRTGTIKSKSGFIRLFRNDRLALTTSDAPGRGTKRDPDGNVVRIARIGCSLPRVLEDVRRGDRVLFDDGKLAARVCEIHPGRVELEITRAKERGQKLRASKGINFPDSSLNLPALTQKDVEDLAFVSRHADIVNYSFVRTPSDIEHLNRELTTLGRPDVSVILKIENPQAFNNLPLLLLEAMRFSPNVGVMIARGDLAVECGWERMVEVQEELLWMCEAAHVPVVWATQVLEGLAKKGLPSRAELTDAGAGARAECVMLNKGPNIVETVACLFDILTRMHEHQSKKRPLFRKLGVADRIVGRPSELKP